MLFSAYFYGKETVSIFLSQPTVEGQILTEYKPGTWKKTHMLGNHAYSFNLIARRKNALSDLQGFSAVITAYHWTIPKS